MIQFLSSLLPALLLLAFIYLKDEHREPLPMFLKGVWYGVLSALIAGAAEVPLDAIYSVSFQGTPLLGSAYRAFVVAALPEESAKLLMLWLLLRRNKEFDEYFDGIVYAVTIGLGFAAFENVGYIFAAESDWATLAVTRGLLSVPAHYAFAVLMGYYYSLSHFMPHRHPFSRYLMLLMPVVAHGIFDMLLFLFDEVMNSGFFALVCLILFFVFVKKLHAYSAGLQATLKTIDSVREEVERSLKAMKETDERADIFQSHYDHGRY